jgi:hypothetical protein
LFSELNPFLLSLLGPILRTFGRKWVF